MPVGATGRSPACLRDDLLRRFGHDALELRRDVGTMRASAESKDVIGRL